MSKVKYTVCFVLLVCFVMAGCTNNDMSRFYSTHEGTYTIVFASKDESTMEEPFRTEQLELHRKYRDIIGRTVTFENIKDKFGSSHNITIIVFDTKGEVYRCQSLKELDAFLAKQQ